MDRSSIIFVMLVTGLALLLPAVARADLPLYSLGMGGGIGGWMTGAVGREGS